MDQNGTLDFNNPPNGVVIWIFSISKSTNKIIFIYVMMMECARGHCSNCWFYWFRLTLTGTDGVTFNGEVDIWWYTQSNYEQQLTRLMYTELGVNDESIDGTQFLIQIMSFLLFDFDFDLTESILLNLQWMKLSCDRASCLNEEEDVFWNCLFVFSLLFLFPNVFQLCVIYFSDYFGWTLFILIDLTLWLNPFVPIDRSNWRRSVCVFVNEHVTYNLLYDT